MITKLILIKQKNGGVIMRCKKNFLIILTIICLVGLSPIATAFDFVEWIKGVLGIQKEVEEGVVFIPIEEIMIKEEQGGLATLNQLEGNVKITVDNLDALDETQSYEAWLIDLDSGLKISLGAFELDESGNGELTADVDQVDISDSDLVMVTIEPVPLDRDPSDNVILEGGIDEIADVMEIKLVLVKEEIEEEPIEVIIEEKPLEEVEEGIPKIIEEEEEVEEELPWIPEEEIIEIPTGEIEVIEEEISEEEKPIVTTLSSITK